MAFMHHSMNAVFIVSFQRLFSYGSINVQFTFSGNSAKGSMMAKVRSPQKKGVPGHAVTEQCFPGQVKT